MDQRLTEAETDRIIEMAWEDRTPFEAIFIQFSLAEKDVILLMRQQLKPAGFSRWRKRVTGRATKHLALRGRDVLRFKCSRQKTIAGNRISKR